jgi:hypothetical protein
MNATLYNIRHRLTQVIVFAVCVSICMLFAQVAEAGRPKPPRFDKPKYRVCVHRNSQRVVKVLQWKRKDGPRTNNLVASNRKSRKPQAMAETDF